MKRAASDAQAEVLRDAKVRVEGVSKHLLQHGRQFAVLQEVDLYAHDGEFVSLIGPSGCGKSTLLNIIAGLEQPSSGTLYLNGRRAEQRLGTVGYMQQKDLLLPWRKVLDNIILGLELRGVSRRLARGRNRAFRPGPDRRAQFSGSLSDEATQDLAAVGLQLGAAGR